MSGFLDDRLPDNIFHCFRENTMTGVASTVDQDGYSQGAPVSMFYALDNKNILMGEQTASSTFNNAIRKGNIALTFIFGGDNYFTIQGRVQLFKGNLESSGLFGALLIEIESVKSNMADGVGIVAEGIKENIHVPGGPEIAGNVMAELRSYTLAAVTNALDIIRNPEYVVTRKQLITRKAILSSIQGRRINASYHWRVWDCHGVEGVENWDDCTLFLENEKALIYDSQGELKFCRPLDQIMFKAFEEMMTISWFDEEMEKIYYSIEIAVQLDFTKLCDI